MINQQKRLPIQHDVKLRSKWFDDVASGKKKVERRINDRDYRVGDTMLLREIAIQEGKPDWEFEYTGRTVEAEITHILDNGDDVVLLSINVARQHFAEQPAVSYEIENCSACSITVSDIGSGLFRVHCENAKHQAPAVDVIAKIDKALNMVDSLCKRERKWVLSIPARPDYDPDIVIASALQAAKSAIIAMQPAPVVDEGFYEYTGAKKAIFDWALNNGDSLTDTEINDLLHYLRPYLTQSAPVSEWQDISTAPKDGVTLLLWCGVAECWQVAGYDAEFGDWTCANGDTMQEDRPTHWMPLAPPPANVPYEGE